MLLNPSGVSKSGFGILFLIFLFVIRIILQSSFESFYNRHSNHSTFESFVTRTIPSFYYELTASKCKSHPWLAEISYYLGRRTRKHLRIGRIETFLSVCGLSRGPRQHERLFWPDADEVASFTDMANYADGSGGASRLADSLERRAWCGHVSVGNFETCLSMRRMFSGLKWC